MRIAYLCTDFGVPIYGTKGASVHVRSLSQALADQGHHVLVLTPRADGSPPTGYDVPVVEFPLERLDEALYESLRRDPRGGPSVAREVRAVTYATSLRYRAHELLRDFGPDLIYERYSLCSRAGEALAAELGVPRIVEVNAPLTEEQTARGLAFADAARASELEILRSADHVVAVSSELERWLGSAGIPPRRVSVLPNAVDPKRFRPLPRARDRVRRMLGLNGQPVVGFLGSLKPWHDTATLVRAVAALRRRNVPTHLVIVGDGPERVGLETLVRDEGLTDHATFTGSVPHERVPSYLAAFDVAVAPYAPAENFYFSPLKLFEYLAAGRPVVAADVGEIPAWVTDGETALLYAPGDVTALADSIRTLIEKSATAARLGEAGREHVRRNRTWTENAEVVTELSRACLDDQRAGVLK